MLLQFCAKVTHSASHYRRVIIWDNCWDNLCSSGHVNGAGVEDASSILEGNGRRAKSFREQGQDRLKIQSALVIMEKSCDEEVSLFRICSCSNKIAASRIHSYVPCASYCIIISIVYDPGHLIKHNPGAEARSLTPLYLLYHDSNIIVWSWGKWVRKSGRIAHSSTYGEEELF